jgi:hypothetical protein
MVRAGIEFGAVFGGRILPHCGNAASASRLWQAILASLTTFPHFLGFRGDEILKTPGRHRLGNDAGLPQARFELRIGEPDGDSLVERPAMAAPKLPAPAMSLRAKRSIGLQ